MAHFAKLKDGNIVERIEVVSNDVATSEEAGVNFLRTLYNEPNAAWVQTSYNSNIRKNFAIVGGFYDATRDAFYEQQPYDSWTLNEDTCQWESPIPYPANAEEEDKLYVWNETTKAWDELQKP
tara:strand:+ start:292 stop:660 length:369 start_codon:yes stop_codon:yes gene_type:complete